MNNMAKAIIADDHPLFRAALHQALKASLGEDIAQVASFDELKLTLGEQPHVELVFLDLNMPGNHGLSGLTELRNLYPDILVVVVSANEQLSVIQRALDFGASAYVPKSAPLELLTQAVHQVLQGDTWVPPDIEEELRQRSPNQTEQAFAAQLEQLTPQQFKVLQCIADGLLNKQIAYTLKVQETTIKQHVSAILRKLGVNNRTQAGIIFRTMLGADSAGSDQV